MLDSAVAYVMPKCDLAVVGAEAVCESGGLINFVSCLSGDFFGDVDADEDMLRSAGSKWPSRQRRWASRSTVRPS